MPLPDRARLAWLTGVLPTAVMLCVIWVEYGGGAPASLLAGIFALAAVAAFSLDARPSRLAFVVIGAGLVIWAALTHDDWQAGTTAAIRSGCLIVALFTALSAIRSAAVSSEEIVETGRFLARQPPGLRYLALTIGGHLFGLILLYGSIALLGSLATESAATEPDPEIRRHRTRRMLIAIQRGFAATLCWSPLGFSMVISISLVAGARWNDVVLPCLVSALLLMLGGWALDTAFKPRLAHPPPSRAIESGRWLIHLRPLLLLLGVVVAGVVTLHLLTGVEVVGAVMSLVPAVAIIWIFIQRAPAGAGALAYTGGRIAQFVTRELPGYRGEILLLFMAAFIGSLGSFLLVPLMAQAGLDLSAVPPLVILVALIWVIPLTGQLGMNPILSVSLMIPLLPTPEAMGVSPTVVVAAITGGWALSGVTSPFTASVLLAGALGKVPPRQAGLIWNGPYAAAMGVVLSLWVLLLANLL
ncbi:hypothetical protein [Paracoccus lutimaris]|uniref:H+/citrate symporter n=1 Tax=Paracoccus lutimaris TaxID=1490030 RepID=A0A368YWX3_9RHOB|nr:hypothetical protein [Paracoccus lutimaris]RCW84068.1 hypothetical protein DFP89_10811 [Paracoccus lutimaris]